MEKIDFGYYYHVYNRGNNRQDIFFEDDNYSHFLKLYEKYIYPITDTYCWCLMKNHFHFLIRIKEENEIESEQLNYSTKNGLQVKKVNPSKQFSHLFNAYTQAVNKKYNRTGSVFEKKFKRKLVSSEAYLIKLISYIHNNPVHHGVVESLNDYKWSSFSSLLSHKPTKLCRKEVIELFGDSENFVYCHQKNMSFDDIEELIIE